MWLSSSKLGEGQKYKKSDLTQDERWENWRGWKSSVRGAVLNGVLVRQIATYVPHICRPASGRERVWAMRTETVCVCEHERSCQGLIECLYMTSSCWGPGCALGKVENNEQRTTAKHNRIHLYLPTAALLCICGQPLHWAATPVIPQTQNKVYMEGAGLATAVKVSSCSPMFVFI